MKLYLSSVFNSSLSKDNNIDLFLEMDIEGVYGFDVYRDCFVFQFDFTD